MRHFIEPNSFSLNEQLALLDLADRMEANPAPYAHLCDGRILATLFYEPSTRTRLSFESAMLRLGGKTLGFAGAQLSSASKGETVEDTARVVSNYADVIAMRHPKEGAPLRAAQYARVPVINAGDGGHAHPSQTMIDLMTIRQRKGRLNHLTIGFCGDLKFGRTVHSLTAALSQFEGNRFVFISPEDLRLPRYVKTESLEPTHQIYKETDDLDDCVHCLFQLLHYGLAVGGGLRKDTLDPFKAAYQVYQWKLDLSTGFGRKLLLGHLQK